MRAGPERSEEPRPGRRFATTSEALASLVIAKREQSQPATGKVDPDDRTGVTHHLATRTGRRIDAHHAPTHLTASFSRCVSRLGSGGRVEPKLQREWPSDPGQMVRHKNLMFPFLSGRAFDVCASGGPCRDHPVTTLLVTSNIRSHGGCRASTCVLLSTCWNLGCLCILSITAAFVRLGGALGLIRSVAQSYQVLSWVYALFRFRYVVW